MGASNTYMKSAISILQDGAVSVAGDKYAAQPALVPKKEANLEYAGNDYAVERSGWRCAEVPSPPVWNQPSGVSTSAVMVGSL